MLAQSEGLPEGEAAMDERVSRHWLRPWLLGSAAALCVALPASASAAVTFGSDLGDPPTSALLVPGFTVALRTLEPGELAPGGVTAPSGGVITHWRVRKGAGSILLGFRVIRGNTSVYQGGATPVNTAEGTYQFDTRVPVQTGDAIGVDQLSVINAPILAGGGSYSTWMPLLGPAETRTPDQTGSGVQLLLNADLEPDADGDGFGDETQDQCPTDASTQGPCPADTTPPQTKITKGAPNKTKKPKLTFKFTSSEPGSTFECKLDKKKFKPCKSPITVKNLRDAKHKFQVRAIDASGNVDPSPAKDKFRVVGSRRS